MKNETPYGNNKINCVKLKFFCASRGRVDFDCKADSRLRYLEPLVCFLCLLLLRTCSEPMLTDKVK